MATIPEPESQPPPPEEPPILTAPEPASVTAPDPLPAVNPTADNAGPPRKRQRRPSVRLGEIGNHRASAQKSHPRQRLNIPPWSWRTPKEDLRTAKGNGGGERNVNGNGNGNGIRRGKAKRGSTAMKRLRSNHAPKTIATAAAATDDVVVDDDGDVGFRDFNHEEESPVNSVQENGVDYWNSGQHDHHHHHHRGDDDDGDGGRGVDDGVESSDSREWMRKKNCEGVRTWLCDLGLSRYAPVFEIHEVDDELLPLLTLEDLKDMGINAVGSRRKMYTSIQKLRKGFP